MKVKAILYKYKERKHYLKKDTVEALRNYLAIRTDIDTDNEYLFISARKLQLSPMALYNVFKGLFIAAGFTTDGKTTEYNLESLRTSFMVQTIENHGVEMAQLKAHHSNKTCTKKYEALLEDKELKNLIK